MRQVPLVEALFPVQPHGSTCQQVANDIGAVVLFPSLPVAVMSTHPAVTLTTSPEELTVATDSSLLAQVTVWSDSGFPLASIGVALSCNACPRQGNPNAGVTFRDSGVTVMAEVPLTKPFTGRSGPLAAVIVASPTPTPVTKKLLGLFA